MVGGGRAAAQRELDQADVGGDVHGLLVQARPQRVERPQPGEQRTGHRRRVRPGEVLEDVMVGVHQAGGDQAAGRVQSPPGRRERVDGRPDRADQAAGHRHPAAGQLPAPLVDGCHQLGAVYEQVDRVRAGCRRGHRGAGGSATAVVAAVAAGVPAVVVAPAAAGVPAAAGTAGAPAVGGCRDVRGHGHRFCCLLCRPGVSPPRQHGVDCRDGRVRRGTRTGREMGADWTS